MIHRCLRSETIWVPDQRSCNPRPSESMITGGNTKHSATVRTTARPKPGTCPSAVRVATPIKRCPIVVPSVACSTMVVAAKITNVASGLPAKNPVATAKEASQSTMMARARRPQRLPPRAVPAEGFAPGSFVTTPR